MNYPMQPMTGTPGMMGTQGMGMNPAVMGAAPGMYSPSFLHGGYGGGLVNLDPDCAPGAVTLDVGNPCCYPPHGMGMGMEMHHRVPEPLPTPAPEVYVVKKGDSVYKIAKRFGTTMRAIILANNLRNPDLIYPGQLLYIPGV